MSSSNDLAQQYQQKTDKQHILDNPDTYIGSVENVDANLWVFDENKIALKTIEYIPGLYKLFDEGIVNCRDHVIRMIQSNKSDKKLVTAIDIEVSEDGTITMTNDGNGIDVAKHPEYNVWIPEMIFGQLRTSTNYNKEEKRIVGGKNGFGFKLVLIWSSYGYVETVDHTRGLKYTQEFKGNLSEICPPTISKVAKTTKPYTKIVFKPDYTRFGIPNGLTSDMVALLRKRTYDIAAVTDHSVKKIKVSYNGSPIPVKNFQQYIDMYIGAKDPAIPASLRVYETPDEDARWEYAVALSPTHEFLQISFVNGICTNKGGKHVDYLMGQITRKLCAYIEKKKKITVNANSIKEQLMLFLRCDIENPAFDSQTKDFMNTPSNKFGSTCSVSDNFIEKLAKMGVMDMACSLTEAKENRLAKKTDGSKTKTIRGIANFIDANWSGTPEHSKDCCLILCEGLSALSGIVSGLSSEDRNTIGIYPLKGKVLNIRGELAKKISENKEISDLKKILGLETGREYKNMADVHRYLRYGKVMFLTDADLDGSHIKGLCINVFHSAWESLVKIPGFLSFMNTPILRAKKGQQTLLFYNEGEYNTWKQTLSGQGTQGWTIKYFKGLGTSTAVEFKEYFANKKIVDFIHNGALSDDSIDKVFNKKRPDDRKLWLESYDKHAFLNTSLPSAKYEEFIDQEMIHFSTYDCARSIPNMVDGLKTSLRKILYSAFKRKLTSEIKVAQFTGYVSETSCYHHGEQSLNTTLIGMAQNFTGSNNINLLEPHGQFGCLAPETPVLMWDGTIKEAKSVIVGDKLIGDDGLSRTVLRTTNGIDDMFEITLNNGKTFTVNSQHILTLYFAKNVKIVWYKSRSYWTMWYYDGITIQQKCIKSSKKTGLSKDDAYYKMVDFQKTIIDKYNSTQIIDMKLCDYMQLSKSNKKKIFMVNNMNNIHWNKQEVPIDPYIFGAWLGDGDHDGSGFTSIDDEIVESFARWADTINAEITHKPNNTRDNYYRYGIIGKNSGKSVSIGDVNNSSTTCIACQQSKKKMSSCDLVFDKCESRTIFTKNACGVIRTNLNPFKEILKKHNLFMNKHIPNEYIHNDEETRLQLLAGFIDTDGHIQNNGSSGMRVTISQSNRDHGHLLDILNIIAQSLGFATSIKYTNIDKLTKVNKLNATTKVLNIFGDDLNRIPTRILRKKITVPNSRRNHLMNYSPFTINPIGKGDFYGWSIDGNERFLLGNFTVTHNSRLAGGDDSASERYIFTFLNPLTRLLFPELDDSILNYLNDDGTMVEPEFYIPILPFCLVNGISGIGTGFSSSIPAFNPKTILQYLQNKLQNRDCGTEAFVPYYEGFKGTIQEIPGNTSKFMIKGVYQKLSDDKIRITELPVGTWTMSYVTFLESLVDGGVDKAGKKIPPVIKDFTSISTDTLVDITIHFPKGKVVELEQKVDDQGINGVEKLLKLSTTVSTTNMHLFDADCRLHKYKDVYEIIEAFVPIRLRAYQKRKDYLVDVLERKLVKISNRVRYIQENLDDVVDLRKKTAQQVTELMLARKFDTLDGDYGYLIKMPMNSVTAENVQSLQKEHQDTQTELRILKETTLERMWLRELQTLDTEYDVYRLKREKIQAGLSKTENIKQKKAMVVKKATKA